MIVVVAILAVGWASSVAALARIIRSEQRAHARREDTLVNQVLHAAGRPWQPAPASEPARDDDDTAPAYAIPGYTDDL